MKIFEISISGSDSGGEGTIVHQIAVLAGYSDLNLNQLADEFLKTDCNRDETIFNDEGDNPNWWCYRPAHAEQFVEWLIQKKGFMRLNVESKDFGVIWPQHEKYHRKDWWIPSEQETREAPAPRRSKLQDFINEGGVFSTLEPPETK